MTERERAERIVNDIHSRVDRDGELDDYWRNLCVMDVLALMREERARGLEEFVAYVERQRWTGHLRDLKTLPQYMADFLARREEESNG